MKIRQLKSLAKQVLQAEDCGKNTEVSILLTNDEEIAELNKEYRDTEGPTDVLSFSQVEGDEEFAPDMDEHLLGDIVISVETAKRQAEEAGKSTEDEVHMLLTHGLLHLLGYDHAEPEEAEQMFARQNELLNSIKVES